MTIHNKIQGLSTYIWEPWMRYHACCSVNTLIEKIHLFHMIQCCQMCGFVSTCADFEKFPHTVRKFVWILLFVRIFNKKLQFSVISAQIFISKEIFISMLNNWTDLNSYILRVLMSYCRRSDYVTSGVFDHGVHGLLTVIRNTWSSMERHWM